MYYVCYPDPGEIASDAYACETADTREEALELAERLAAKYQAYDRSDFRVFDASLAIPIPAEPDPTRCPCCGEKIDISGIDPSEAEYDPDACDLALDWECPHCGAPLKAVCDDADGTPVFYEFRD